MKATHLHRLCVGALALLFAFGAAAQERVAVVATLSGAAQAEDTAGVIRALAPKDRVFANETLRTGRDGHLGLIFNDDTTLTIGPRAEVVVDAFVFDPRAGQLAFALDIARGVFAYTSGTVARLRPDAVALRSNVAVIGIRGTRILGQVADPRVYARAIRADAPVESAAGPVRSGAAFAYFGGDNVFVLTPDADGQVGAIELTRPDGSAAPVRLARAQDATRFDGVGFAAPFTADAVLVERVFAGVIANAPPPPATFILYFEEGVTTLTPESAAVLDQIVQAAAIRDLSDVAVSGHADRTGDAAANLALSLRRADAVAAALTARGLPAELIGRSSHGEGNPLVPTADGVVEPRNRRVEVVLR